MMMKKNVMKLAVAGLVGLSALAVGFDSHAASRMVDLQSPAFTEMVTKKAKKAQFNPDLVLFIARSGNPGGSSETENVFCIPEEQTVCNPNTGEYQNIREVFPKFDSDVEQNIDAAICLLEEIRAQDPAFYEQMQERWRSYQAKTLGKATF